MITTTKNGIERAFSCSMCKILSEGAEIKKVYAMVQEYTVFEGKYSEKIGDPFPILANKETRLKYRDSLAKIFEEILKEHLNPTVEGAEVPEIVVEEPILDESE